MKVNLVFVFPSASSSCFLSSSLLQPDWLLISFGYTFRSEKSQEKQMKGRSLGERRVLYDWNLKRMPNKSCAQTPTGEEEDPPNEAIDKSKTISESDEKERSKNICQRNLILLFFFLLHKKIFFRWAFLLASRRQKKLGIEIKELLFQSMY